MGRKVFISFLGTNTYIETYYSFADGCQSALVKYVQEALIAHNCQDWTSNDKILIFCTKEAERQNWYDNGHKEGEVGLEHSLRSNSHLFGIVEKHIIPEGFSEEEIWDIFDIVYGELQEEDSLYFDVTHAFRSIPLFSTVLFNYSRFMKHTNIVSIQYGAFEKLGPAYKVKELPLEQRIAPILDLTSIVRLEQFTDMISSLHSFGRLSNISLTLSNYIGLSPSIKQLKDGIDDFDNYIITNKIKDIQSGKWLIKIKNAIKSVLKSTIPVPIKQVIMKLDSELDRFEVRNSYANVEAAIEWALKYKMLPSAYTLGQEYLLSLLYDKLYEHNPFINGMKKKESVREFRLFISAVCSIKNQDLDEENYKPPLADYPDLVKFITSMDYIKEFRRYYPTIGVNRNILNHAKATDKPYSQLLNEFNDSYYPCLRILKSC